MSDLSRIAYLCIVVVCGWLVCTCAARGQDLSEPEPEQEQAAAPALPTSPIARVEADEAPVIDGVLDDAAWESASVIDLFTQVDPIEGNPPTQQTEVRVLYTATDLYIGVRCYDDDPAGIRATQMRRDGSMQFDDFITVTVDPFFDRRNGYLFEVNPLGAKVDALVEQNRRRRDDWDGIWYAAGSTDEEGWVAELRLPFQTISFNAATDEWGFNVQRVIRRYPETVRWASPVRTRPMTAIGSAGVLEGIDDITQGLGLDVRPYVRFSAKRDEVTGRGETEFKAGVDIFKKITPELTLAVTVNTDFAETDVDERRVNLTRFPLFFPEKRAFFLQDAGIFNFGGIGRNPLPFFSRRIGLGPSGQPIDILGGLKLTGRVNDLNVGILGVRTDGFEDINAKNLGVARLSLNVLEESTVGIIATGGDPLVNRDNSLFGADFNYRNSEDFGEDVLNAHIWAMRSSTQGETQAQNAYGGSIRYESDVQNFRAFVTQIDEGFNPALGFAPRKGIREYIAGSRRRWRPGTWIKRVDVDVSGSLVTDTSGSVESVNVSLPRLEIENLIGDSVELRYRYRQENLSGDFEIFDGVVIPEGDYTFGRFELEAQSSTSRPVRVIGEANFGTFYDGRRTDLVGELEWRPNPNFSTSVEYEWSQVDLPGGDFIVRIARARADIAFTTDISWVTTVQWDNVSQQTGLNTRLRWIITPGSEFFVVFNQGFSTDNDEFNTLTTEGIVKALVTFRF